MVRLTLASHITIVRIVLIPLLAMALLYGHHVWALIIFISAAVSDALDGVVARRMKQTTSVGAIPVSAIASWTQSLLQRGMPARGAALAALVCGPALPGYGEWQTAAA